jgi:hypothetical protein
MTDDPTPKQPKPPVDPVLAAIDAAIEARRAENAPRLNASDEQRATALALFVEQVRAGHAEAAKRARAHGSDGGQNVPAPLAAPPEAVERFERACERLPTLRDFVAGLPVEQRRQVYRRPLMPSWDDLEAEDATHASPLPRENVPTSKQLPNPPVRNLRTASEQTESGEIAAAPAVPWFEQPSSWRPGLQLAERLKRASHPPKPGDTGWMRR